MPKTVAAVASPRCAAPLWVSSRCSSPPSSRQWRPPPRRPRRDRAGMSPRRDTPWAFGSCPSSTRRDRPPLIRTRRYPPPARRRARCRPPSTTRRRVRPRSRQPTAPTSRKPTRPLRRPATSLSSSSATARPGRPTTTPRPSSGGRPRAMPSSRRRTRRRVVPASPRQRSAISATRCGTPGSCSTTCSPSIRRRSPKVVSAACSIGGASRRRVTRWEASRRSPSCRGAAGTGG